GSTWKRLVPPAKDSQGNKYDCDTTSCALHIHGYTERLDPRATYSSPSIVGLLMAVGNVGTSLAPYTQSDTFLSRDAGFTWEEVHKDAHLWEFGDSGSILIMANDEEPTDHYCYCAERYESQVYLASAVSSTATSVAVHIDFSALTHTMCQLSVEDPGNDDFELWSPSEERSEQCLFGRQTLYHRRVRNTNCVVGNQPKAASRVEKNSHRCLVNSTMRRMTRTSVSFVPGTTPLADDDASCDDEGYWYERTAYRKIPYSTCEGGERPDRGMRHECPGFKAHGAFFWWFVIMVPFMIAALVGYWYYKKSGLARGQIRLPGDGGGPMYRGNMGGGSGIVETLASVPWFVIGVAGIAWSGRCRMCSARGRVPVEEGV
ncbi:hypothetical protein BDZ89DRAFT_1233545, partial [Hymenopellis radicata]